MKKWMAYSITALLCLGGLFLLFTGIRRPVEIYIETQRFIVQTRALTVGQALRDGGVTLTSHDRVTPPAGTLLAWQPVIRVQKASQVNLLTGDGLAAALHTIERIPANLLGKQGIRLYPHDRLLWNSETIDPLRPLPLAQVYNLQLIPAQTVAITTPAGQTITAYTAAQTVAQALADAGITPSPALDVQPSLDAPLPSPPQIRIQQGRELRVQFTDRELLTYTHAQTVGQALAQAGVALQSLDYSQPPESASLPADGRVRVVRVREEILLEQQPIPFDNELVPDSDLELDQRRVVEPGQYGIEVSRVSVRYEDGQEVSRQTEETWTASQPVTQKMGYGTKIEIRTLDTPSGPIEYWRAVTVYATSYSPCRSGTNTCHNGTASGLPVRRGVIGVTRAWYNWMIGQGVYIPGYGPAVVADMGGGIPGTRWIDLGFTDDEYEAWHSNVTLYFLTPVPENIPWILP